MAVIVAAAIATVVGFIEHSPMMWLLREQLHGGCSFMAEGEGAGSFACADGIGYVLPLLVILICQGAIFLTVSVIIAVADPARRRCAAPGCRSTTCVTQIPWVHGSRATRRAPRRFGRHAAGVGCRGAARASRSRARSLDWRLPLVAAGDNCARRIIGYLVAHNAGSGPSGPAWRRSGFGALALPHGLASGSTRHGWWTTR